MSVGDFEEALQVLRCTVENSIYMEAGEAGREGQARVCVTGAVSVLDKDGGSYKSASKDEVIVIHMLTE